MVCAPLIAGLARTRSRMAAFFFCRRAAGRVSLWRSISRRIERRTAAGSVNGIWSSPLSVLVAKAVEQLRYLFHNWFRVWCDS